MSASVFRTRVSRQTMSNHHERTRHCFTRNQMEKISLVFQTANLIYSRISPNLMENVNPAIPLQPDISSLRPPDPRRCPSCRKPQTARKPLANRSESARSARLLQLFFDLLGQRLQILLGKPGAAIGTEADSGKARTNTNTNLGVFFRRTGVSRVRTCSGSNTFQPKRTETGVARCPSEVLVSLFGLFQRVGIAPNSHRSATKRNTAELQVVVQLVQRAIPLAQGLEDCGSFGRSSSGLAQCLSILFANSMRVMSVSHVSKASGHGPYAELLAFGQRLLAGNGLSVCFQMCWPQHAPNHLVISCHRHRRHTATPPHELRYAPS